MKTSQTVTCPLCQSEKVDLVQRQLTVDANGRTISFYDEYSLCRNCEEGFYTREQSLANSRAYTAALRRAEGLLSPDEIRDARGRLGMTQPQFEQALGVGPKTVVRWERGTVPPSRAANVALWLAANHPETFLEYARTRVAEAPHQATDVHVIGRIFTNGSGETMAETLRTTIKRSMRKTETNRVDAQKTVFSGKESMS